MSSSITASGLPRWASASAHESRRPRRRPLGEVAEHRRRAGGAPPADRSQLHRRQVLRLVDDHVAETRRALQQVGELVDEGGVGGRPPRRRGAAWRRFGQRRPACSSSVRTPSAARASASVSVNSSNSTCCGLRPRARPARCRPSPPAAGDRVLDPIVGGVAVGLHPQEHRVGQPLRQHLPPGRVTDASIAQGCDRVSPPRRRARGTGGYPRGTSSGPGRRVRAATTAPGAARSPSARRP